MVKMSNSIGSDTALLELIGKEKKEKDAQFLKSWKVAVNKLGADLFNVQSTSVEAAADRKELRPNLAAIRRYVHKGENELHYFLFMVVSFYSFVEIEQIFANAGLGFPRVIDLQLLDDAERLIIYALVEYSDVDTDIDW